MAKLWWWLHLAAGAKMEKLGILGGRFSPTNEPVTRLGSPTAPPPKLSRLADGDRHEIGSAAGQPDRRD
jgi:hypothetical protein